MSSPILAGLLYKKRGGFGKMMFNSWQYRFFAISKDGLLIYFDTDQDNFEYNESKARGSLNLNSKNIEYCTDPIEGAPTSFTIQIGYANEEKWKLCVSSIEEQSRWCSYFEKFIKKPKGLSSNASFYNSNTSSNNLSASGSSHGLDDSSGKRDSFSNTSPLLSPRINSENFTSASQEQSMNNTFDSANNSNRNSLTLSSQTVNSVSSPTTLPTTAAPQTKSVISTSSPVPKTTNNTKTSKKKKMTLSSNSKIKDKESHEGFLVLILINLCFFGIISVSSPSFFLFLKDLSYFLQLLLFFLILNAVVAHTLFLRHQRKLKELKKVEDLQDKNSSLENEVQKLNNVVRILTEKYNNALANSSSSASASTSNVSQENSTAAPLQLEDLLNSKTTEEEEDQDEGSSTIVRKAPSGKFIPGFTLRKIEGDPKVAPLHTWSVAEYKRFQVRGYDYLKNNKKVVSEKPLYDLYAVDVFCAKKRVDHVSQFFELPDTSDINTYNEFVPPLLTVQIQIPSEPPTSLFSSSEDGPGWAVVMYFKISEDTINQLKDFENASAAVKLFAQWCQHAPNDPAWRSRFKLISWCSNMDELGFPSLVTKYNSKPVLIRKTGSLIRGKNYLEFDLHVHKFANLAKQTIHAISNRCGLMYMQIGFVVEGRDNKELPETLFACAALNRPQEDQAEFIFEE